jgi:tetrahydromethanopterin S-methyltransferase subunit G
METMRESWTDERLDDFAANTERRFDRLERRMDAGFDKVDERFEKVETRLDKIDERFEEVNARFEALHFMMHRTMVQLAFALGGTVAFGFLGIIVASS